MAGIDNIIKFDPSNNSESKTVKNEQSTFKRGTDSGDFLRLYQDPTSLGFKLFFHNIGDIAERKGNSKSEEKTPPAPASFLDTASGAAGANTGVGVDTTNTINSTGLFGNAKNPNSALYYLESIGDFARYDMLIDFKLLLSKLNSEYPWYFQSIEGLSEAWQRDYSKPKFKKELTITCLESIDLRITALMDLYRKIAYDWQNRRAVLPDNLRKFDITIKVFDVRSFQKDPGQFLGNNDINETKYKANNEFLGADYTNTNQVNFDITHCEFMPDESGSVFSTISNSSYDNAAQTIKIGYENIAENSVYRSLVALGGSSHYYVRDYLSKEIVFLTGESDSSQYGSLDNQFIRDVPGPNNPNFTGYEPPESMAGKLNGPSFVGNQFGTIPKTPEQRRELLKAAGERAKTEIGGLVEDIRDNISAAAANLVKSKLNSLLLGNVYGFSPSTLAQTAKNQLTNAPAKVAKKKISDLGNTFGSK
jgi:hypothetical protein